ncbi:MAG: hypothetical protein ACK55Z_29275, partial [bacterium]
MGVDADDRFVAAADIGGVDRNIEHIPRLAGALAGPGLFDGVLVRAAEGGEYQFPRVRVPRRHLEARRPLVDLADLVDVAEVEPRVDAVGVE